MTKLLQAFIFGIPAVISGMIAFLTRKVGVATATISTVVFLTVAMIACINVILNTVLTLASIPAWLVMPISALMPGNFVAVLSAIVSARICGAAFDMAMGKVKAVNTAT